VELHIEELILEGLGAAGPGSLDRNRLVAAVERELSRLIATRGVPAGLLAGGAIDRLRADPLQLDSALNVAALGGRLAEAIYGSFGAPPTLRASAAPGILPVLGAPAPDGQSGGSGRGSESGGAFGRETGR
jgi:hypothetical protein